MKAKLIFAWYDIWVGFFWDSKKKRLYFFPIPTMGVVFDFKIPKCDWHPKFDSDGVCTTCGFDVSGLKTRKHN